MKKRTSHKAHTRSSSSSRKVKPFIPSTRIIIIGSAFAVLLATVVVFNKQTVRQSVEGVSIMRGLFGEATIQLPQVPGAVSYNIYYDIAGASGFTHAARGISVNETSYTVQYLKKGTAYTYQISAVDGHGKEIWFSPITSMTDIQQM